MYTQYMDIHSSLGISQTDGRPMYLQIMEQIRQLIAIGEWVPGQEIPSIRQLAVALKVSVITVKRAYLELEREGLIVTQQGKGSTVAAVPALGTRVWEEELHRHLAEVVRLGTLLRLTAAELTAQLLAAVEAHNKERA